MRRLHFITFTCCMALIAPCLAAAPGGDLGKRVEAFRSERGAITTDHWSNYPVYRAALETAYQRWFPDDLLGPLIENAERPDLSDLFFATLNYSIDVDRRSANLETVFAGLEAKGWADDRLIGYMHQSLLIFRRFDEAKTFREAHPQQDLSAPPPIIPSSHPVGDNSHTVLRLRNDGSALERQLVDLQSPAQVIVLGHCHFSSDAIADIAADPALAKAMNAAAIWLAGPATSLTDGKIAEWNREHPDYAYRYIESRTDWPEINEWGTPSFYFMKDGKVVKKVVGWPDEGRKEDLRAGLRAIAIAVEE